MIIINKSWTHELAKQEALKYNTRVDLEKYSNSCYQYCSRNKILDEVCSHMNFTNTTWTHELAKQEALKYNTRHKFSKGSSGCYFYCLKNKILDEVCGHMYDRKWDLESSIEEAKKYNSRSEFSKGTPGCYIYCRKNNLLDTVCSHMKMQGNLHNRFIYVFEFENNHVYIGLTYNTNTRYTAHINGKCYSSVYNHIQKTNSKFEFKVITENPIPYKEAQKLENDVLQEYKDKGWNILNKAKTGGLGGNIRKWTEDTIRAEAKKYNSRVSFQKNSSGAYRAAKQIEGLFDEVCSHMITETKPKYYWNDKQHCLLAALECKNKAEFDKKYSAGYKSSVKHGWLNEFFSKHKN